MFECVFVRLGKTHRFSFSLSNKILKLKTKGITDRGKRDVFALHRARFEADMCDVEAAGRALAAVVRCVLTAMLPPQHRSCRAL